MAKDKTTKSARDRDADEQLKRGKVTRHRGGASSRASAKPENAGLSKREIDAIERENSKHVGGGFLAITGRARRGGNR
jgi:hypothetical protein